MSDTIFTDDFPFIETQEELDRLFKQYPQYDQYYIASGAIKKRRIYFDKLRNNFKPYADKKFPRDIKQKFHNGSREMYIGNKLIENNLKLNSYDYGPDFIINNKIYIECTITDIGDVEPIIITDKVIFQTPPIDKIILRITSAIKNKITQYNNWKDKPRFNDKSPYIIAINSGAIGRPHTYEYIASAIMQCLFGIQYLRYDQQGNKKISPRKNIIKKNGSNIDLTYFINEDYNFLNGIIFTDNTVFNLSHQNCVYINNPFATNIIKDNILPNFDKWHATKDNFNNITLQYIKGDH